MQSTAHCSHLACSGRRLQLPGPVLCLTLLCKPLPYQSLTHLDTADMARSSTHTQQRRTHSSTPATDQTPSKTERDGLPPHLRELLQPTYPQPGQEAQAAGEAVQAVDPPTSLADARWGQSIKSEPPSAAVAAERWLCCYGQHLQPLVQHRRPNRRLSPRHQTRHRY